MLELVLAKRRQALQNWSESGGGAKAVNLEVSSAEVDLRCSGVYYLQLRRELREEVECMVRVANVPLLRSAGEVQPLETIRRIADTIVDMLIADEEAHPDDQTVDTAENAVVRVMLQLPSAEVSKQGPQCGGGAVVTLVSTNAAARVLRATATRVWTMWNASSSQEQVLNMLPVRSAEDLGPAALFKGYEVHGMVSAPQPRRRLAVAVARLGLGEAQERESSQCCLEFRCCVAWRQSPADCAPA